jgi:hypothetical protein
MTSDPDLNGDDLDAGYDDDHEWQATSEPEPGTGDASTRSSGKGEQRKPEFADPEQFVREFLSPLIQRRLGGSCTWCSWWWAHAEGVLRITALWETWEHFRHEGALGMSTWLLHHADPHLAVLMSTDGGPFAACKPDRHVQLDPLPCADAPPGMWAAAAFSDPAA